MKIGLKTECRAAPRHEDEAEMRQIVLAVLQEADSDLDSDAVCERALYRKT